MRIESNGNVEKFLTENGSSSIGMKMSKNELEIKKIPPQFPYVQTIIEMYNKMANVTVCPYSNCQSIMV